MGLYISVDTPAGLTGDEHAVVTYIAGYLLFKSRKSYPDIASQLSCEESELVGGSADYSWISVINRGGLTLPHVMNPPENF